MMIKMLSGAKHCGGNWPKERVGLKRRNSFHFEAYDEKLQLITCGGIHYKTTSQVPIRLQLEVLKKEKGQRVWTRLSSLPLPATDPGEGERPQVEDRGQDCCRGGICSRVAIW